MESEMSATGIDQQQAASAKELGDASNDDSKMPGAFSAPDHLEAADPVGRGGAELLQSLLRGPTPVPDARAAPIAGVVVGKLLGITDSGTAPLVSYPSQPCSAALVARSVVDLHGVHVGKAVVLVFEAGDPARPIVIGILRDEDVWPLNDRAAQVEVDVDGERMIVSARDQLVLRCGKASVTLTKAGKVLIAGTYVSSRSSGVNRVKGGSVQLN